MSVASLREHLVRRSQHLGSRITKAEREIESSDLRTHVKLAAQLKILRERQRRLEARLANLDSQPEGALSEIKADLLEEADQIEAALLRWIDKY